MLIPKSVLETLRGCDYECAGYALSGVHFSRDADGKPWAAATDSRMLIAFTWDDDGDDNPNIVVPQEMLDSIRKTAAAIKGYADSTLTIDDGRARLELVGRGRQNIVTSNPLEGRFPRYADVMPRDDAIKLRIHVRIELLAKAIGFLQAAFKDDYTNVEIGFIDHDSPLRIVARQEGRTAQVVIMPVAEDEDGTPIKTPPTPFPVNPVKAEPAKEAAKKPAKRKPKKKAAKKTTKKR